MLRRRELQAIRALLGLALDPGRWHPVRDLALAQDLPAPMLEQLMLRLRRAGLVEAKRGRSGGYRLGRAAAAIPLAEILTALAAAGSEAAPPEPLGEAAVAADHVTAALERRLRRALEQELAQVSLEDLLYDLHSARASLSEEGGLLLG